MVMIGFKLYSIWENRLQLWQRIDTTLAALFLLVGIAASQSDTPGEYYPQNGAVNAADFFPQWEISYYAVNYLPVCGSSTELEGDEYWTNSPECEPAMATFNGTSIQVSLYDTAGVALTASIGQGTELCMCYAVAFTPKDGHILDICLLIGKFGEVIVRRGVAVGIQNPERNKAKALPQCKDVDLSKYSQNSALPTSGFSAASTVRSAAPTSAMTTYASTSTVSTNGGGKSGSGLSTEGKIALGVGLPGAITSTAAIIWFCWRRTRPNTQNIMHR